MGSRILLADDSITIQKVVNLTFAEEGIEVISVSNGDLAERRLREVNPDLVLADIFMPGKNGYELCETIKRNPQYHAIPVVLLVGAFEPFNEAEARRVQADAHLTKPFVSRILVETVRNLIEKSPKPKVNTASLANGQAEAAAPAPPTLQPPVPPPNAVMVPPVTLDMSAMGVTPTPPSATPAPPVSPYPDSAFADPAPMSFSTDATPFADSFPASFETPGAYTPTIEFSTESAPPAAREAIGEVLGETGGDAVTRAATFDQTQAFYSFDTNAASDPAPAAAPPLDVEISEATSIADAAPTQAFFGQEMPFDASVTAAVMPVNGVQALSGYVDEVQETATQEAMAEMVNGEVVVDFDAVETREPTAPTESYGFSSDTGEILSSSSAAVSRETVATYTASVEPETTYPADAADAENADAPVRRLDTNELVDKQTQQAQTATPAYGTDHATADTTGNDADSSLPHREFAFFESTESATTLLKSDEPLGDVLMDALPQDSYGLESATPLDLDEPPLITADVAAEYPVSSRSEADGFARTAVEQTHETSFALPPGESADSAEPAVAAFPAANFTDEAPTSVGESLAGEIVGAGDAADAQTAPAITLATGLETGEASTPQSFVTDGAEAIAAPLTQSDASGDTERAAADEVAEEPRLEVVLPTPPEPVQFVKNLASGVEYNFYTETAQEAEVSLPEEAQTAPAESAGATAATTEPRLAEEPSWSEATTADDAPTMHRYATLPEAEASEATATAELSSATDSTNADAAPLETIDLLEVPEVVPAEVEAASPVAAQEPFTAADMWTTEEPQFTPISVEMARVSAPPVTSSEVTPEASAVETTPAAAASPAVSAEAVPPAAAVVNVQESAGAEMSQEQMIEEIVRRVVAQLSDTVVREVAWEVVPDCVERVVSTLTREGLDNRK